MMVQNLKPEIKIVIGSLFGDEGKGNIVQHLCKEAISRGKSPCVIRFSGGPQCGHRVIHNKIEHVFSSFGSGSLLNVPTFIWIVLMFILIQYLWFLNIKICFLKE